MVTVTLAVATLSLASFSVLTISSMAGRENERMRRETSARFLAEGALTEAIQQVRAGEDVALGTQEQPLAMGGGTLYVEEFDLGSGMVSLVATARDGLARSRVELVLQETQTVFHSWAAFGDDGLTMDSNARVDSYDSSLGDYTVQATNGGGASYALENGHIGSNQAIEMDKNSKVWGDATPGPTSVASVLGNATVSGSTAPAQNPVDMPALEIPVGVSSGDLSAPGGGPTSLAAGSHFYDTLTVQTNGELIVAGPATIVVDSLNLRSGAELRVNATGGPVEIYVLGDFIMNSNTLVASTDFRPRDIALYLESDNIIDPDQNVDLDEIDFDSNAQMYGTVYAPLARVEINSNFELFGSLIARQVHLDSNSRIHFDEDLLDADEDGESSLQAVCWRPVSGSYVPALIAEAEPQ